MILDFDVELLTVTCVGAGTTTITFTENIRVISFQLSSSSSAAIAGVINWDNIASANQILPFVTIVPPSTSGRDSFFFRSADKIESTPMYGKATRAFSVVMSSAAAMYLNLWYAFDRNLSRR